ncbi:MAG TPA: GAF domain-containing protein [Anaerolineales bacterium]|nr:GAF domain-containing protein [Anaerolineales bacterium]
MLMKFLAPPIFENDEEKTRVAGLLNAVLLFLIGTIFFIGPISIFLSPAADRLVFAIQFFSGLPFLGLFYVLMKRGYVQAASVGLIAFITVLLLAVSFLEAELVSATVMSSFIAIATAALFLGPRSLTALVLVFLAGYFIIAIGRSSGWLQPQIPHATEAMNTYITVAINLILGTTALALGSSSLRRAITQSRSASKELNTSNQNLLLLQAELEDRVAQRTEELANRSQELEMLNLNIQRRASQFEALAQVTQSIISVRDLQEILPHITTVISDNFGFYHIGIFLIDEVNEYAVLSATNSEGGRKMLERKHRLLVGEEGIVGTVTATGEPRIAMDVGTDAVFFNNPELPHTHSEIALPLKSGERIIGALDVQSTATAAFTEEDIQMLGLLASQVSLAIENARLFDETRNALTKAETVSRQFTREAWGRLHVEQNLLGYRYNLGGATPLDKPVDLAESSNGQDHDRQSDSAQVIVPIELRGELIGKLSVQSPTGTLSPDQIDIIKAVAERVALSAENARLFEETTRRAERERLVSDITGKIRSVSDPQSMIQTAMDELRKVLGASRVEVVPQNIKGSE